MVDYMVGALCVCRHNVDGQQSSPLIPDPMTLDGQFLAHHSALCIFVRSGRNRIVTHSTQHDGCIVNSHP